MFFKKGETKIGGTLGTLSDEKWFQKLPHGTIRKMLEVFSANSTGMPEIEKDKSALLAAKMMNGRDKAKVTVNRYTAGNRPDGKQPNVNAGTTMSQDVVDANVAAMERQFEQEAAAKAAMEKQYGHEAVAKAEEEEKAAASAKHEHKDKLEHKEENEEHSCPFNANERLFIRLEGLNPHNLTPKQIDQFRNWFATHNLAELEAEERTMNRLLSNTVDPIGTALHLTADEQAKIDAIKKEFDTKFGKCDAQEAEVPSHKPTIGVKQRSSSASMGVPD